MRKSNVLAIMAIFLLVALSGCKTKAPEVPEKKAEPKAEKATPATERGEQAVEVEVRKLETPPEPAQTEVAPGDQAGEPATAPKATTEDVASPEEDVVEEAPTAPTTEPAGTVAPSTGEPATAPSEAATGSATAGDGEPGAAAEEGTPDGEQPEAAPEEDEEEAEDSPHFGEKFKLQAVMMINDVVKNPEHYSQFDEVQLRGKVLGVSGSSLILGFQTEEGMYAMAVNLTTIPKTAPTIGQILFLEGKLEAGQWDPTVLGIGDMMGKPDFYTAQGWILTARSGEFDENR